MWGANVEGCDGVRRVCRVQEREGMMGVGSLSDSGRAEGRELRRFDVVLRRRKA